VPPEKLLVFQFYLIMASEQSISNCSAQHAPAKHWMPCVTVNLFAFLHKTEQHFQLHVELEGIQ
jgi:hypothetical protein